jgi:hypothetical protein
MNVKKIKQLIQELSALVDESEGAEMATDDSDEIEKDSSDDGEDDESGSFRVKSVAAMMKKKMMAGA